MTDDYHAYYLGHARAVNSPQFAPEDLPNAFPPHKKHAGFITYLNAQRCMAERIVELERQLALVIARLAELQSDADLDPIDEDAAPKPPSEQ